MYAPPQASGNDLWKRLQLWSQLLGGIDDQGAAGAGNPLLRNPAQTFGAPAAPASAAARAAVSAGAGPTVAAMVEELRAAGISDNGIRGILANAQDESGFNPALRHPDQPRFGGEAHYAHGLYQEGGTEWNNYDSWLKQNGHEDWTDPRLQTRFLAQRLQSGYPGVWKQLNEGSPEQAAQAFVSGYLRPAENYRIARSTKYGRGVPELDAYAK